jgi:hypothetical protein
VLLIFLVSLCCPIMSIIYGAFETQEVRVVLDMLGYNIQLMTFNEVDTRIY